MPHIPTPWTYECDTIWSSPFPGGVSMEPAKCRVADIRGWGHLQYRDDGEALREGTGERIVACVNALSGVADPAATMDEIVNVLATLKEHWDTGERPGDGSMIANRAKALLSKLTPA